MEIDYCQECDVEILVEEHLAGASQLCDDCFERWLNEPQEPHDPL
jgi:hypothetical protein